MWYHKLLKLLFILSVPLVLLINGCGQKKSKQEVITLAFWSDEYNRRFAQRLVNDYNSKQSSTVPIKFMETESQHYTDKLLTMIAGGTPQILCS